MHIGSMCLLHIVCTLKTQIWMKHTVSFKFIPTVRNWQYKLKWFGGNIFDTGEFEIPLHAVMVLETTALGMGLNHTGATLP